MKNRYVDGIRLGFMMEELDELFTYSPPDDQRKKEHEHVNEALLAAAQAIRRVSPDSRETEMAIEYLWVARNCANGALATYKVEEDK